MKKQLLTKAMLLLCTLVVGSGSVWAEDITVLSADFNDGKAEGWTLSGSTSFQGSAGAKSLQIGASGGAGSATTPAFSTLKGTKATLTFSIASSGSAVNTLTITGNNCKVDGAASTTAKTDAKNVTIAITEASTTSTITFSAIKKGGVRIDDVLVVYTKTSDSPLASIALSGSYPTTFGVGDEFNHDGMTVTATYENGDTNDVTTAAAFTGYDMSQKGSQTVIVSYTENEVTKTTNYSINVKAAAGLSFTPASVTVAIGGTEAIAFSKSTDATVTFDVADKTIAKYDAETGMVSGIKEGVTTLTAISAATDDFAAGEAVCTITVSDPYWIDYTKKGYTDRTPVTEETGSFGKVTLAKANGGTAPTWYDNGTAVRIYTNNTITITAKEGYLLTGVEFSVTSGSMSADKFDKSVTQVGKTNEFTLDTPSKEIVYTTESNFRIDKVKLSVLEIVPATITAAEYATFVSTKALDFSSTGITVYTATDGETKVTLNEVTSGKVPANVPVVLYKAGADGTAINVPVIAAADTPEGTNDLKVSTGTDVENMYVLAKNPTIGFYPWGGASGLSAGKVYLQGKASYGAREFLGFDSETTGISDATRLMENGEMTKDKAFHNLNGQRVNQPTHGLYIVNGRKVVIK